MNTSVVVEKAAAAAWTHAEIISACGAAIALAGAAATAVFALINVRNAVKWKRAELANSYLKELVSDETIAFATRSLDWLVGTFAVPARLLPLVPGEARAMQHDYRLMIDVALKPMLTVTEMQADFRVEVYRTAIDGFLTWLSIVSNALERQLFSAADIGELRYWIVKIASEPALMRFAKAYEYDKAIASLCRHFEVKPQL